MTLYLYNDSDKTYIGELKTAWVREQIPPGTLIIFKQNKYIVVTSEAQSQPYTFVVTVNPA